MIIITMMTMRKGLNDSSFLVSCKFVACLDFYETFHFSWLRKKALDLCYDHIKADDEFTKCISVGPVSRKHILASVGFETRAVLCDSSRDLDSSPFYSDSDSSPVFFTLTRTRTQKS